MTGSVNLGAALAIARASLGEIAEAEIALKLRRGELTAMAELYQEGSPPVRVEYACPLPPGFWVEISRTLQGHIDWAKGQAMYVAGPPPGSVRFAQGIYFSEPELSSLLGSPSRSEQSPPRPSGRKATALQAAQRAFLEVFPAGDPGPTVTNDELHARLLERQKLSGSTATWSLDTSKRAAGRR